MIDALGTAWLRSWNVALIDWLEMRVCRHAMHQCTIPLYKTYTEPNGHLLELPRGQRRLLGTAQTAQTQRLRSAITRQDHAAPGAICRIWQKAPDSRLRRLRRLRWLRRLRKLRKDWVMVWIRALLQKEWKLLSSSTSSTKIIPNSQTLQKPLINIQPQVFNVATTQSCLSEVLPWCRSHWWCCRCLTWTKTLGSGVIAKTPLQNHKKTVIFWPWMFCKRILSLLYGYHMVLIWLLYGYYMW